MGRPRCCEAAYMVRLSPRQRLFSDLFLKVSVGSIYRPENLKEAFRTAARIILPALVRGPSYRRRREILAEQLEAGFSGASEHLAEAAASVAEQPFSRSFAGRNPPSASFCSAFRPRASLYIRALRNFAGNQLTGCLRGGFPVLAAPALSCPGCSCASPPLRARYARCGTSRGRRSRRCRRGGPPPARGDGGSGGRSSVPARSRPGRPAQR